MFLFLFYFILFYYFYLFIFIRTHFVCGIHYTDAKDEYCQYGMNASILI